jgi:hypothetical protein
MKYVSMVFIIIIILIIIISGGCSSSSSSSSSCSTNRDSVVRIATKLRACGSRVWLLAGMREFCQKKPSQLYGPTHGYRLLYPHRVKRSGRTVDHTSPIAEYEKVELYPYSP